MITGWSKLNVFTIHTDIKGRSQTWSVIWRCQPYGAKIGGFRLLLTTHKIKCKINASTILLSYHVAFCFHIHTQIAVDAGDICTLRTTKLQENPKYP